MHRSPGLHPHLSVCVSAAPSALNLYPCVCTEPQSAYAAHSVCASMRPKAPHTLCALYKLSQILHLNPPDTDSELQSVFFLAVLHQSDQLWDRADTSAAKSKVYLSSGREE